MHLLPSCTHDAAPHKLPVAQVVELAPLVLAVQGDLILLNGQVKVPLDILQASSKEEEPGSIGVELQPGKLT